MADKLRKPSTGSPRRSQRQAPRKRKPKEETPTRSVANGKKKSSAGMSAQNGTKANGEIRSPASVDTDSNRKNGEASIQRIAKSITNTPAANDNKRKRVGITHSGSKPDKETFSSSHVNGKKRKITKAKDFRVGEDFNTRRSTSGNLVTPSPRRSSGRNMSGPSPPDFSSDNSIDSDFEGSEASDNQNPQDAYLLAAPPMYPVRTEIWYPTFPPYMRNMIIQACQIAFALRNGSHKGRVEDVLAAFADRELARQVVIEIARQQRELPPTAWEMQTLYPAWSWVGPGHVQHPSFMPINFVPAAGLQPGGVDYHQHEGHSFGGVDANAVVPDVISAVEDQQYEHAPSPCTPDDASASGGVEADGGRSPLVAGVNCPPNVLQLANLNTYPHPRPVGMPSAAEDVYHSPGFGSLASAVTSIANAGCMTSTGVAEASVASASEPAALIGTDQAPGVAKKAVSLVASLPKTVRDAATMPSRDSAGTTRVKASRSPAKARSIPGDSPSSLKTQAQSPTIASGSSFSAETFRNLNSSDICANATCGRCLETCYCSRKCQLDHLTAHMHKCDPASKALRSRTETLQYGVNEQANSEGVLDGSEKCASMCTEHPVRCIRCRVAQYCSITCQIFDWPEHMEACILHADVTAADAIRITALEKWATASYTRIAQYLGGEATFDDPKDLSKVMEQIEQAGAQFSTVKVTDKSPLTESDEAGVGSVRQQY